MLADTQLFFLWIVLMTAIYWLIPPSSPTIRQAWLIVTSFIFIYAHAPIAGLSVLWMTVWACLSSFVFKSKQNAVVLWSCLLLACLPLLSHRLIWLDASLIATLGVTFATLRAASVIIDRYADSYHADTGTTFLYMMFLPLYTVGPIDKAHKFAKDSLQVRLNIKTFARGITRSCMGIFKSIVIADQLIRAYTQERFPQSNYDFTTFRFDDALVFIALSFLYTYVNFSAFVDIAIGVSRMMGFEIMENFKFPIFARNLQDFWKRWHISLGNWITNYLYLPIVFVIGKPYAPYIATFLAFSLIGWWHDSSANYILWGVLHGTGLCIVQFWLKTVKKRKLTTLSKNSFYILASWIVTIFYVAWVQTVANLSDLQQALEITKAIFRI